VIALTEGERIALLSMCGAVLVAVLSILGSWLQAHTTRKRNTLEHDQGRAERLEAEERLNGRLGSIDGAVRHTTDLLIQHVQEPNAHGRGE
jgi:hypothetical protein